MKKDIDWLVIYKKPETNILKGFTDSHTRGLNLHGHNELATSLCLDPKVICKILNNLGLRILDGERFDKDEIRDDLLENHYRLQFKVYGDTTYVIFPDPNNRLPGEEGCKEPYDKQLIYAEIIENDKE